MLIGKIVAIAMMVGIVSTFTYVPEETIVDEEYYEEYSEIDTTDVCFFQVVEDDYGVLPYEVSFYEPDELNYEILVTRNKRGEIIIERTVGIVLDEDFNGRILNTDSDFNYISYKNLGFDVVPGDVVVTYSVYSTENDFEDDFERYDYLLDEGVKMKRWNHARSDID